MICSNCIKKGIKKEATFAVSVAIGKTLAWKGLCNWCAEEIERGNEAMYKCQ